MNMVALNNLGSVCESNNGPKRMLAAYGTSLVSCGVASYIFEPRPSLGASGRLWFQHTLLPYCLTMCSIPYIPMSYCVMRYVSGDPQTALTHDHDRCVVKTGVLSYLQQLGTFVTGHAGGVFGLMGMVFLTLWRNRKVLPVPGFAQGLALTVAMNGAIAFSLPVDSW